MPLILNIDTATEFASICIAEDEDCLAIERSMDQKSHASFVQPAIKKLLERLGLDISCIDAIAVTAGPGSYTGLRVGLSTAKGLCYALNKPLILANTLEVMALAGIRSAEKSGQEEEMLLYCPMIDARRLEVFTAVYNSELSAMMEPQSMVLDEHSFEKLLSTNTIVFSGSGHKKCREKISNANAVFSEQFHSAEDLAIRSAEQYRQKNFADLAYSEPFYLKDFYSKPA